MERTNAPLGAAISLALHLLGAAALTLGLGPAALKVQAPPAPALAFFTRSPGPRSAGPSAALASPSMPGAPAAAPRSRAHPTSQRERRRAPLRPPVQASPAPAPPQPAAAPDSSAVAEDEPSGAADASPGQGSGGSGGSGGGGAGGGGDPAGALAGGGDGDEPVFMGEGMTPPRVEVDDVPAFPWSQAADALAAHVEGLILVTCQVSAEGVLRDCRVLKRLPHLDDAVILGWLAQWKLRPARQGSHPISIRSFTLPIRIQLPSR